eukprot:TRINITY_DN32086_c0_g1_i1.p1 TRINITY_DN32086_c0_g1~~TRINITY_DN32086_c0_g1_i1.p1  ORF type:complete len:178 (+),score=62.34 TRINITY_DN32086_c0_g1_i1:93-626(+)
MESKESKQNNTWFDAKQTDESKIAAPIGRGRSGWEESKTNTGIVIKNQGKHFAETGGIPTIHTLEEENEEDITTKIAEAPRNENRGIQSLNELDNDIRFTIESESDGIDLSLLTSMLCPPGSVLETDEPWKFDTLLQSVAQDIQLEKDRTKELHEKKEKMEKDRQEADRIVRVGTRT